MVCGKAMLPLTGTYLALQRPLSSMLVNPAACERDVVLDEPLGKTTQSWSWGSVGNNFWTKAMLQCHSLCRLIMCPVSEYAASCSQHKEALPCWTSVLEFVGFRDFDLHSLAAGFSQLGLQVLWFPSSWRAV